MGLGLKKDDTVIVIAGDEKGKKGRVLDILSKKDRVIVEKIKVVKRHMKPSKKYSQGGIIEKEAAIHRSNIMLVCPKCDKATIVGNKVLENRKKIRLCKKCGEVLE